MKASLNIVERINCPTINRKSCDSVAKYTFISFKGVGVAVIVKGIKSVSDPKKKM